MVQTALLGIAAGCFLRLVLEVGAVVVPYWINQAGVLALGTPALFCGTVRSYDSAILLPKGERKRG